MAYADPPGWYVISLRPQDRHAALRRAAARHGGGLIALSPWRLEYLRDPLTRAALERACRARVVVFTSPAAVVAAARLQSLVAAPGQQWLAVGGATAAALRRAGVDQVQWPSRMDSEGLLELAGLAKLEGVEVGLVTAPEGRQVLATTLLARGASLVRADVYRRVGVAPTPRAQARLRALQVPAYLALSSEAALVQLLSTLPGDLADLVRTLPSVAASERLQQRALQLGLARPELAEGPLPAQLVAAIVHRFR